MRHQHDQHEHTMDSITDRGWNTNTIGFVGVGAFAPIYKGTWRGRNVLLVGSDDPEEATVIIDLATGDVTVRGDMDAAAASFWEALKREIVNSSVTTAPPDFGIWIKESGNSGTPEWMINLHNGIQTTDNGSQTTGRPSGGTDAEAE